VTTRSKSNERKARKAAELQLFARRYARKSRPCFDPNDRNYDRDVEAVAKRMKSEELDAMLRYGEDD